VPGAAPDIFTLNPVQNASLLNHRPEFRAAAVAAAEQITGDPELFQRYLRNRIATALDSFAKGRSRVEEDAEAKLSIVTLAPEIFSYKGFRPTRHGAPFTAISHHARGEVFLIATPFEGGWTYRIDYPYYSWAETIVRPTITRQDFRSLMDRLNELEKSTAGSWRLDNSELASAAKFSDQNGKLVGSGLSLDVVASQLRNFLLQRTNAQPAMSAA